MIYSATDEHRISPTSGCARSDLPLPVYWPSLSWPLSTIGSCRCWPCLPSCSLLPRCLSCLLFGEAQGGSKSWINVAGTLVQPTEAGKFLVIIFLSWYLSWFQDRMGRLPYLVAILVLLGAPLVLVFIQPDFGMTITYAFLGGALILVAGVRYRHLAMLVAGGGPGAAAAGGIAAGLHAGAPLHLYAHRRGDRADSAPDPRVPAFQL